ncbi:MAG: S1 RNA-binding domain-containing protein [Ruminococcus sp.]|jgi:S1 RNA binding domain protein|nr:S1 RNA-binding domain-containing protein [Ruminococcus sp.]
MQVTEKIEVDKIYEGKVVGVQNFGAFVEVAEPHFSGMVHISEVANRYVADIKEFVKEGDIVKVKVLTIGDGGKISLSMKKADETAPPPREMPRPRKAGNTPRKTENTFDDMLAAFKRSSEEKMGELKRQGDRKNGRR